MKAIWACRRMRGSNGGEMHGERRATSGLFFGKANPILVQRICDEPEIELAYTGQNKTYLNDCKRDL